MISLLYIYFVYCSLVLTRAGFNTFKEIFIPLLVRAAPLKVTVFFI